MVCASNMNRSMEAHAILKEHGYDVSSYGVGSQVKLPGASQDKPNVYPFGTTYQHIFEDLKSQDESLYMRNGLLKMLQRNAKVKQAPEKWQLNRDVFDVVVTFEDHVMEKVVDDLQSRPQDRLRPVVVININVKDNHEEAARVAPQALKLCQMLEESPEWEEEIDSIIRNFQQTMKRPAIYTICFY